MHVSACHCAHHEFGRFIAYIHHSCLCEFFTKTDFQLKCILSGIIAFTYLFTLFIAHLWPETNEIRIFSIVKNTRLGNVN